MSEFYFRGRIPASKSILNRLLILKSFAPAIEIDGDSRADDVLKMKSALSQLKRGELADCGAAGTTLRFLALRASRMEGPHHLSGTLRLFARPHAEVQKILHQLGCEVGFGPQRITIVGQGWRIPKDGVKIERSVSSQFASALVLSAWELPEDLQIHLSGSSVSYGYLQMTLETVREAGMNWRRLNDTTLEIPAGSRISKPRFHVESDLSSAFAVAGVAAVSGEATFEDWPEASLQPDAIFESLLSQMGCQVFREGRRLTVKRGDLRAIDCDLKNSPDLFPVLAVLCALADGRSRLLGAPHLAHKESDRVAKSAELVRAMGRRATENGGGLDIEGSRKIPTRAFEYDPEHDHRLAMAAAVARAAGVPLKILRPEVVNKSFPEFWSILEGGKR